MEAESFERWALLDRVLGHRQALKILRVVYEVSAAQVNYPYEAEAVGAIASDAGVSESDTQSALDQLVEVGLVSRLATPQRVDLFRVNRNHVLARTFDNLFALDRDLPWILLAFLQHRLDALSELFMDGFIVGLPKVETPRELRGILDRGIRLPMQIELTYHPGNGVEAREIADLLERSCAERFGCPVQITLREGEPSPATEPGVSLVGLDVRGLIGSDVDYARYVEKDGPPPI